METLSFRQAFAIKFSKTTHSTNNMLDAEDSYPNLHPDEVLDGLTLRCATVRVCHTRSCFMSILNHRQIVHIYHVNSTLSIK